jgi:hypothetical protein
MFFCCECDVDKYDKNRYFLDVTSVRSAVYKTPIRSKVGWLGRRMQGVKTAAGKSNF